LTRDPLTPLSSLVRLLRPQASLSRSEAAAATDNDDAQDGGFAGRRHRRSRIRQLTEGSSTTLMLVTVVVVFLAVELPSAVTLILLIAQYTFAVRVFARDAGAVATLVCNLVILLSYPTNSTSARIFCKTKTRRQEHYPY